MSSTVPFTPQVAESSLSFDRGTKLRLYAKCGVPESWIVPDRAIEAYTEPAGGNDARVARYERGQSLRPLQFEDLEVRVTDVMK